jgi:autotransporter-associated beta strand protein
LSSLFDGTITDSSSGSGSIRKIGSGTFTLTGANNSYSGRTSVDGGTLLVAHQRALGVGTLAINSGASGVLQAGLSGAAKVAALDIDSAGGLDMHDNDLVVGAATTKVRVEDYIRAGRNFGAWDGVGGITSSAARASGSTALGVLSGEEYNVFTGNVGDGTFSGEVYTPNDTLVKYAWYGDADFTGGVDFDDYVRIDAGFNGGLTGWANGDFDLSGIIDFDDYVLIDLGFNSQNGTLRLAQGYLSGERDADRLDTPGLQRVMKHFNRFGSDYAEHFLAAVPEPGVAGGFISSISVLRRRRRVGRECRSSTAIQSSCVQSG